MDRGERDWRCGVLEPVSISDAGGWAWLLSMVPEGERMPRVASWSFWAGAAGFLGLAVLCGWAAFRFFTAWGTEAAPQVPAQGGVARVRESASVSPKRKPDDWRGQKVYDSFPPLVRFAVVGAGEVGSAIADDEFIIGVEVDGESRAYPLNMLGHPGSEVVNDVLAARPIAVTFCGLCETPLVFARRVGDQALTFYVSGTVVESNMTIKDVETRSEWIQLLGKAVDGPLEGKELERLPAIWTDWKTWRTGHPKTTAVMLTRGSRKYSNTAIRATGPREKVYEALQWGLAREGKARSWPFSRLARQDVVNDSFAGIPLVVAFDADRLSPTAFDRRLGGRELKFRRQGAELVDEMTGSVWDPLTGRAIGGALAGQRLTPIAGTVATNKTWRVFHPDGEVWDPDEPSILAPAHP